MAVDTRDSDALDLEETPVRRRRAGSWIKFGLIGASGILVNQLILVLLTEVVGVYYLLSAVLATLGSTTWNFVGVDGWVFADRRTGRPLPERYFAFLSVNVALLVARVPMLWLLTDVMGIHYSTSNLITLAALFVLRVVVADMWVWRERSDETGRKGLTTTAEGDQPHRYDVAGILAIESDVELRELRGFATARIGPPDIVIRTGMVEPRPARRVTFVDRGGELVYREHLGPLSSNFTLKMGDPIRIKVSPVLAMSPHVVYTNIVEAFLRFLLVSKGYVLLHSAGLVGEHGATLLSAQTDTGKTSTVITLVRSRGYRFLSDDMTIIDPRGEAISYPKPMTLSFHTMGVAKDGRLTVGDRAKLSIQSRLHSKSGRQVGRALGEKNLPIMTINSIVQAIVPPPKHRIEDLFDCAVGGRSPIRNIVLMERGPEVLEEVPLEDAVDKLLENTDDAYGFPPFASFAPKMRIGDMDYVQLRERERDLLRSAISNARRYHLRVEGHGWAERLPAIIDRPVLVPVGPGTEPEDRDGGVGVPVGPGHRVASGGAGAPVGVSAGLAAGPTRATTFGNGTDSSESSGIPTSIVGSIAPSDGDNDIA